MAETRIQACAWITGKVRTEKSVSLLPPHIRNISSRLSLHLFKSLQPVLYTHRNAVSFAIYHIQTWICPHCVHLAELRSGAQYCVMAFIPACCLPFQFP